MNMALLAVSRVGSLVRIMPQLSVVSARGFSSFDERERGEEACAASRISVSPDVLCLPVPLLPSHLCIFRFAVAYMCLRTSDPIASPCIAHAALMHVYPLIKTLSYD